MIELATLAPTLDEDDLAIFTGCQPLTYAGVVPLDKAVTLIDDAVDVLQGPDGMLSTRDLLSWLYDRGYGVVETAELLPRCPAA